MPLIGDSIKKTGFQEEEGMVELTGFARSISTVMTVSENLARQKWSSWHHLWHFQQENKEQVPNQPDPIQVIVEADVDSAQVGQVIYTYVF